MNKRPQSSEPELVWEHFEGRADGFFVEVGANEPRSGSQTWQLEQNGWRGILVEPLSSLTEALIAARPGSRVFRAACTAPGHPPTARLHVPDNALHASLCPGLVRPPAEYVGWEMVRLATLDEILSEAGVEKVDFVSIDVEGMQLDVLKGFSLNRYRPALLLVEDHLLSWQTHLHLRRSHYCLIKRTGLNDWYIPVGAASFGSPLGERLRLWRKVWPGTPVRRFKHWLRGPRRAPSSPKIP